MPYAVQAAGVGTSSTLSSVREGDVPSVVKYAPRFKPQASAGSKSTMSRRVVEENKAALAPTALQSMLHYLCLVTNANHHVLV